MKRIVTILFFVGCWLLGVGAQNMKVLDFKLLEKDLTANTRGTQKLDMNGETAALIKIQTPERGFSFDGGMQGIVASEEHAGEIWLYVPRRAQKLIIQHPDYGVLRDYYYPINIEGGKTYEMLIDIGTGRYATITSGVAKATVFVDGDNCGISPVRKYLNYGRHTIKAVKDRFEGETTTVVTTSQEPTANSQLLVQVDMQDMSHLYGDVTVTVDNKADIFYNGLNMGTGEWKTQLREGNYTIETRKANSDPAMTSFTVVAQRQNNIKANAPVQHTGWLHVYTRPRNVKITPIDVSETQTLSVGTYQLEFTRKGFVTQNREYTVRRNETTLDTVTLQRVTYVKPLAFFFGGGFTLRSLSGVSAFVGAVYQRHDLQASYTFGLTESDVIYWDGDMNTGTKYKMQSIGIKYGYQFPLMRHLAITPQIGWNYNFLTANPAQTGNTTYGDGASSQALTIGAKVVLVPMQHLYIFMAPEYMFALSKDNNFKMITENSNVSGDGFAVHAGLLVNF
jgi:hypothetical protein